MVGMTFYCRGLNSNYILGIFCWTKSVSNARGVRTTTNTPLVGRWLSPETVENRYPFSVCRPELLGCFYTFSGNSSVKVRRITISCVPISCQPFIEPVGHSELQQNRLGDNYIVVHLFTQNVLEPFSHKVELSNHKERKDEVRGRGCTQWERNRFPAF